MGWCGRLSSWRKNATSPDDTDNSARAITAAQDLGLVHTVTRHGPVRSLEEAAAARGVEPRAIVKTLVVRVSDGDYRFVLVPGDREISWPKLRELVGVNRLSMPSAEVAFEVTVTCGARSPRWEVRRPGRSSPTRRSAARCHWAAERTESRSSWTRRRSCSALGAQVADVAEPA